MLAITSGNSVATTATRKMKAIFFRAGRRVIATPASPTASASPRPGADNRNWFTRVSVNSGSTPRLRNVNTRSVSDGACTTSIFRLRHA